MMNRKGMLLSVVASLLILPSLVFSQSPEASESAPLDTIKENVKKRIQEVVEKNTDTFTETAYIGTLSSRTTTSLTLETKNGSQLASGSAQVIVENASNKAKSSFEDLEIGDYMSIVGMLDAQDVLIAERILLATEPKAPINKHFFGLVSSVDTQEDTLTITTLPSNEEKVLELNSKSLIEQATPKESREIALELIPASTPIIVVYAPGTTPQDSPTLVHAVIKVNEFLEPSITPTSANTSPSPRISPTSAKAQPARTNTPSPRITP
jgi:hypothetical protein